MVDRLNCREKSHRIHKLIPRPYSGKPNPLVHEEDTDADRSRDHNPESECSTTDSIGAKTQQRWLKPGPTIRRQLIPKCLHRRKRSSPPARDNSQQSCETPLIIKSTHQKLSVYEITSGATFVTGVNSKRKGQIDQPFRILSWKTSFICSVGNSQRIDWPTTASPGEPFHHEFSHQLRGILRVEYTISAMMPIHPGSLLGRFSIPQRNSYY